MLYYDFMKKAEELVLTYDEDSGLTFLEPDYFVILRSVNMDPESIEDSPIDWLQFSERMKLEADRRNKIDDRSKYVIDWLFSVLTAVIEPAMMKEESELVANVVEYMNKNQELKEKEKDLQHKEDTLAQKQGVVQLMPGMNFAKKGMGK